MKILFNFLIFYAVCYISATAQTNSIGLNLQVSNPNNITQVGWFNIDSESIDRHNVKNNSLAVGLVINHFSNHINWRLRIQFTNINLREYNSIEEGLTPSTTNTTGQQRTYDFSPGIFWNISSPQQKLIPYLGFETPITLYGEYDLINSYSSLDRNTLDIISRQDVNIEIPRGYTFGINGIFGFNYGLFLNMTIGAEFSSGLVYNYLGGIVREETKYFSSHNNEAFTEVVEYEDTTRGISYSGNRFSFQLGINF